MLILRERKQPDWLKLKSWIPLQPVYFLTGVSVSQSLDAYQLFGIPRLIALAAPGCGILCWDKFFWQREVK
jgi:hypothetical protein